MDNLIPSNDTLANGDDAHKGVMYARSTFFKTKLGWNCLQIFCHSQDILNSWPNCFNYPQYSQIITIFKSGILLPGLEAYTLYLSLLHFTLLAGFFCSCSCHAYIKSKTTYNSHSSEAGVIGWIYSLQTESTCIGTSIQPYHLAMLVPS